MGLLYDLIFGVFILTALLATLGNYLDKKLGTTPWLAIAFGITAIILGLFRLVMKASELGASENKIQKK